MAVRVQPTSGLTNLSSPLALVTGSAPQNQLNTLIGILEAAKSSRNIIINVNTTTGLCAAENVTLSQAVARLHAGQVWVDYGNWPFGMCSHRYKSTNAVSAGFASFVLTSYRGSYGPISPPDAKLFASGVGVKGQTGFELYAGGNDAFDYFINPGSRVSDWSFSVNMIRSSNSALGNAYPYAFGLPVSAVRTGFRPMPNAPIARIGAVYGKNVNQTITIYSAFALKVGSGWYFEAQPSIGPTEYAAFILTTLGLPVPKTGSQEATTVTCAQTNKPTLTRGAKGAYVQLAQQRLNAWGHKITVDGVFGPQTESAVLALQRAHDHQYYGGKEVLVTGQVGPGTWNMLCSNPGTKGATKSSSSPPSPGSGQQKATSLCSSSTMTQITKATGLSCTTVEILGIGAGLTLLALLMR